MERIEYFSNDKSEWGEGPWQSEPDKVQWLDKATGLPCLIVRGSSGALCGYVGVTTSHSLYRKDYDDCDVDVHGGLTFAHSCASHSREDWEEIRAAFPKWEKEAARYPKGDAARRVARLTKSRDNYEEYVAYCEATSICHLVEAGETDNVWWLGFDCAHAGDFTPAINSRLPEHLRDRLGAPLWDNAVIEYRDIAYVTREVESLARQLGAMEDRRGE